jgi:hypothetical protein
MGEYKLSGTWFFGNEASDYAKAHGYLDYRTLAQAFDAVLANEIMAKTWETCGYWELENGNEQYYLNENGDYITQEEFEENGGYEEYREVYQYYIISDQGARILKDYTNELIWYNGELDLYVWGVTHWGTSWDYVLTDIKLNCGYGEA